MVSRNYHLSLYRHRASQCPRPFLRKFESSLISGLMADDSQKSSKSTFSLLIWEQNNQKLDPRIQEITQRKFWLLCLRSGLLVSLAKCRISNKESLQTHSPQNKKNTSIWPIPCESPKSLEKIPFLWDASSNPCIKPPADCSSVHWCHLQHPLHHPIEGMSDVLLPISQNFRHAHQMIGWSRRFTLVWFTLGISLFYRNPFHNRIPEKK